MGEAGPSWVEWGSPLPYLVLSGFQAHGPVYFLVPTWMAAERAGGRREDKEEDSKWQDQPLWGAELPYPRGQA